MWERPTFLLALVIMWFVFSTFGVKITGLFSQEYQDASWSVGRFVDMLKHIWVPMLILGTDGTARFVRIVRANLLDELSKPYVETARAKGLPEWKVVMKYPVRIALNPFISTAGWQASPALLRQPDRRHGLEPPHRRSPAAESVVGPGHVPGRLHCHDSERLDHDRHPHLRHYPCGDGPADPHGSVNRGSQA